MKTPTVYCTLFFLSTLGFLQAFAEPVEEKHTEFARSNEQAVRIILEVSFSNLTIARGESDKIAVIDYDEGETAKQRLNISYDVTGRIGTLRLRLKESTSFWDGDDDNYHRRHLTLQLSDAVPISFEIELGAGKGDIDLSGLQIKNMRISTGASKVTLRCESPNSIAAENIEIESGVSKFTGTSLGNLNFANLKFNGGVGSYSLDLTGKMRQNADVQVEVGLGSIDVVLPKTLPARLLYDENWFSSFTLDDDFSKRHNDEYETDDYQETAKHMTLRIEAGLGSVHIRRTK
jgi:hypothetical protein